MKKWILLFLCAVFLTGCNGPETKETERPTEFEITEIPFTMDYNGKNIACKSVELYQSKVNYKWHPHMIIRFDTSNLTEDDIHWITTAQDFGLHPDMDITVFYYSEQNDISTEIMPLVEKYTNSDTKELTYIFYEYMSGTREDFSDIEVHVSIDLAQKEKHEVWNNGKKQEENYIYSYDFRINDNDGECIKRDVRPDTDITEEENRMFEQGLGSIAKLFGMK